jgi:hypothetical protein
MGGHLVHLGHLLSEFMEKGGPLAIIGAVAGAVLAYFLIGGIWVDEPLAGCTPSVFGDCPKVFNSGATAEHVVGVLFGAVVGAGIGGLLGGGFSQE